jgi:hypothetical protein
VVERHLVYGAAKAALVNLTAIFLIPIVLAEIDEGS